MLLFYVCVYVAIHIYLYVYFIYSEHIYKCTFILSVIYSVYILYSVYIYTQEEQIKPQEKITYPNYSHSFLKHTDTLYFYIKIVSIKWKLWNEG